MTPDIPALREALAADRPWSYKRGFIRNRFGFPLMEAPDVPETALAIAAVNALPGLLDLIDAQQRVVNAAKPFGEAFLQRGPVGNTYRLSSYERELCAALKALKRMEAPDGR